MRKLAVVASHPIQYQAPLFRALAGVCDLTVFFCHRQTAQQQSDAGFGVAFDWDVPLLDGYRSVWLSNVSANPNVERFSGCDTPDLRDHLAAGRFDGCLVSGWYLKSYLQAIRACKTLGIRVMVRGDSQLKGVRGPLTRAVKYLPYRWLLARIDAHLYVGSANREYLRHYGVPESRLTFSPHFVDNDRFAAAARVARESGAAGATRAGWKIGAADVAFLFAGKLIDIKRVGDFIEAIARAHRDNPRIRGVIVGAGPEEPALRALAGRESAAVHFAGFRNQSDMPACYAAADCLVLPSASESWGLVINEGMAAGIPAIVSDHVGCAPDLIADGVTGFTFPVGNVAALSVRLAIATQALTQCRHEITAAVTRRIARYSCANAVAGVVQALEGSGRTRAEAPLAVGNGHG